MNYLAHALLADRHPESLIGNLAGDFVKGPVPKSHTPRIRRGILLHRRVDSYTDSHPEMAVLKPLFSASRRRYAGIILDISFDHFLTRNWNTFCDENLSSFISHIYQVLTEHHALLPGPLQSIAPRLVAEDWLSNYSTLTETGKVLDRVSKRLRRVNPLAGSIVEVSKHYVRLEAGFLSIFPEVVEFAGREAQRLKNIHI